jgi:preprotein translocase SecE subunit
VARNRKRAKERRARQPRPSAAAPGERDEAPSPIRHAAPDVELAEAQLALGRPELAVETAEPEPALDREATLEPEPELDPESALDPEPALGPQPEPAGPGRRSREVVRTGDGAGAGGSAAAPAVRVAPGTRLVNFLQGSWRELQRVQWPDRRQVMQATGVVIGFVIVAGVYLGVADWVSQKLMSFILK